MIFIFNVPVGTVKVVPTVRITACTHAVRVLEPVQTNMCTVSGDLDRSREE